MNATETLAQVRTRWAANERTQQAVNDLVAAGRSADARKLALDHARETHAGYPQYDGYWDGWDLAPVTTTLRSKGGVQASEGDHVLVHHEPGWAAVPDSSQTTFYSVRLGWNCGTRHGVRYQEPVA